MKNDRSRNASTILIIQILLIVSLFTLIPTDTHSTQPPINLTSYRKGTIGQPTCVDPAIAYDTASGELIFNVYEPLIFFSDKKEITLPPTSTNVSQWGYADLSKFAPVLALQMPTISANNEVWIFMINTSIPWQPWQAANGTWYYQFVTAKDVEYSFKRMLVQDMTGSPSWMFCLPLCGHMFFNEIDGNTVTNTIEPTATDGAGERLARDLINAAVTLGPGPNEVSLHMLPGKPWPQTAFKQILAQTWGCITNRDFCIEHGCWDGSFADGWSINYRQKPSNSYTPLDLYYAAKSKYASASSVPAMCGTGPYIFNYWDKAALEYQVYAWENLGLQGIPASHVTYRGGWNAGETFHSLRTITVKSEPFWTGMYWGFLAGVYDTVYVPREYRYILVQDHNHPYSPLDGISLYYDIPTLSNEIAAFCWYVNSSSPYVPRIGGFHGIYMLKPDFFSDTHVRRAFCQALDFTQYLAEAWGGEAMQPCTWWVEGLAPDYKNKDLDTQKWKLNYAAIQAELTAAGYWESGFETCLCYSIGNVQREIACEMMRDAIQSLNLLRVGMNPFVVNVVGLNWGTYFNSLNLHYLPMFFAGWLADFADADNSVRPYMHSQGIVAALQYYGDSTIDGLIDSAVNMPDGQPRNDTYQQLQSLYHEDPPGLPIAQALGCRWSRDWVRGWYLNQLYPGDFFYDLYKTSSQSKPVALGLKATTNVTEYLNGLGFENTVEIAYPYGTDQNPPITISVGPIDDNATDTMMAAVSAMYTDILDNQFIADVTVVSIPPNPVAVSANVTLYDPNMKIGLYTVKGRVDIFSSTYTDYNLTDNEVDGGSYNATWLLGDINNDRKVELMDFFHASNAYLSRPGKPNWNVRCDIYGENGSATSPTYAGDGIVELMDFYWLSAQYLKKLPGG